MVVHRVHLYYSTNGANSFHGWLSTWMTNMQPWTDDEVVNEVPSNMRNTNIDGDGVDYYAVQLAFEWTEDKSIILDQINGYLSSYCDWHRIGYHVCDHDEQERDGCSWDEVREGGSVPDDIPSL